MCASTPVRYVVAVTPGILHKRLSQLEAITWGLLLLGMAAHYIFGADNWTVSVGGGIHGFAFLAYCAVTVIVWVNLRWPAKIGIIGLVISVIPFATIPFEIYAGKKGYYTGPWRFTDHTEKPKTAAEHVLATIVRHPVFSATAVFVAVLVLYVVLLLAGPPTGWFSS